jgi:hypothetical protein
MTTATRPHRSRRDHLQGLLQGKQFLCATEPAWERRGPAQLRDLSPSTARSTTSRAKGGPSGRHRADHRPERKGGAMRSHRRRILAAIAAVGALVAAALIVLPARRHRARA